MPTASNTHWNGCVGPAGASGVGVTGTAGAGGSTDPGHAPGGFAPASGARDT